MTNGTQPQNASATFTSLISADMMNTLRPNGGWISPSWINITMMTPNQMPS